MARRAERGSRTAALVWAAIAEIGLAGGLLVWLTSPVAAATAGYGSPLSMILVVASMLVTATGLVVLLTAARLIRGVKWATGLLLAVTAGGVIPLAMTDLFGADTRGYYVLLVLAVIGMGFLAAQIARPTS